MQQLLYLHFVRLMIRDLRPALETSKRWRHEAGNIDG